MGIAGTEVAAALDQFLAAAHPFSSLIVRSDGYTACLGSHGGEDGAVIAVGTGTIGFQVEGGRESRVGGWGFPHGDEGGGALLGLEAVRKTLQWLDGREPVDPLLEAVKARFDGDQGRLVSWANAARETEFGEIAPLVVELAGQKPGSRCRSCARPPGNSTASAGFGGQEPPAAALLHARRIGEILRAVPRRRPCAPG